MSLIDASLAILLATTTVGFYLWLRSRLVHPQSPYQLRREQPLSHEAPTQEAPPARQKRGVRLLPVFVPNEDETETDVDIIALHGLDTKSPDTWVWKDKERKVPDVNWLSDPHMLPSKVGPARIFTCDWPAEMFEPSDLTQKTNEEFARCLLDGIKRRPPVTNDRAKEDRPILFIASCLGGIILMKALDMANNKYACIRTATRGIVFLATPFQGTSFQDVAKWAEPGLRAWASIRGQEVSKLLNSVKESFDLNELVRRFTQLCQEPAHPYQVMTFYELGKTNLYHKVFPCLPVGAKPLVDKISATLQIVRQPLPLHRSHRLMNKFGGPKDDDYLVVAGQIEEFLQIIRKKEADDWIRDKQYTAERLKIERLSGDLLPMDQCYINLAIVEQLGQDTDRAEEGDAIASPFSLLARQKVQTPDKRIQVELAAVFNELKGRDGRAMQPRRILIRGRAGVGKTTLCKKIVYEFSRGTCSEWTKMFDRVLWVPLRNLKLPERRQVPGYNFEHLFSHEYFSLPTSRPDLARELSNVLATKRDKTLFLLDGLDEVSRDLGGNDDMSRFLKELLKQPNVIITSRPSANAPPDLHLELETIGFYPEQVKAYLDADPEMRPRAQEVRLFLQEHWLIESLVRIPIQLDALCYAWNEFHSKPVPSTMTGIYKAITQSLWKKDAVRLGRTPGGEITLALYPCEIDAKVGAEIDLLEYLAFHGLRCDIIEFTPAHQSEIMQRAPQLRLSLDETLAHLSFLRTSDHSSKSHNRNYHFLHLTFQEYFAARYFTRKWTSGQSLDCLNFGSRGNEHIDPKAFLRSEKYNPRYDILWRFVTGLLAVNHTQEKLCDFFNVIEDEPQDLLGPAHQRLLMHCLSEVAPSNSKPLLKDLREKMELRCQEWSMFEYKRLNRMHLCCESEFPDRVLSKMLSEVSDNVRVAVLQALVGRSQLPASVLEEIVDLLKGSAELGVRRSAVAALREQSSLSDNILQTLISRLEDTDSGVRRSAAEALGGQSSLPDNILQALTSRLEDTDHEVRRSAAVALGRQSSLPDNILQALASRLEHTDDEVWRSTAKALAGQSSLPDYILQALVSRLEDTDDGVRMSAAEALGRQSSLSDNILQALVSRLEDTDDRVKGSAAEVLAKQSSLPDNILQALVSRLEHTDNRSFADWAFAGQSFLSRLSSARHELVAGQALGWQSWQSFLPDNILQALVSRLEDTDDRVKGSAIEALAKQSSLLDNILQALMSRLEDTDSGVRRSATKALGGQSSLSDNILQALASRLEHTDAGVRRSAAKALAEQSSLPDNILQALVSRLEDTDDGVRRLVTEALDDDRFYSILSTLHIQTVRTLYRGWVDRSISEQLSCYMENGSLYIQTAQRRREIASLKGKDDLMKKFLTEASAMGRPGSR